MRTRGSEKGGNDIGIHEEFDSSPINDSFSSTILTLWLWFWLWFSSIVVNWSNTANSFKRFSFSFSFSDIRGTFSSDMIGAISLNVIGTISISSTVSILLSRSLGGVSSLLTGLSILAGISSLSGVKLDLTCIDEGDDTIGVEGAV